jgi:hypothetical protein
MTVRLVRPQFGLDSTSQVAVAAHRAAGSSFAVRHLSRDSLKALTEPEVGEYRANGIGIVVVFDDGAEDATRGSAEGRSDAEFALGQARALGMPPGRPIFFAVDFDTAGSPERTDAYFDGVASVIGQQASGPYGGFEVVQRQLDRGFQWGWQTYAWSGSALDARAQLYQFSNGQLVGGVGVNFNNALYEDYGQWEFAPGAVPDPDPHHYQWFPDGPFAWQNKQIDERWLVQEYDRYRAVPHLGASREMLDLLREDLALARKHVWNEAHIDAHTGQRLATPTWTVNHRAWRWQQLLARSRGQRVV